MDESQFLLISYNRGNMYINEKEVQQSITSLTQLNGFQKSLSLRQHPSQEEERCSQARNMRVAHSFMTGLNVPPPAPLRAGLLGPRVVSPRPQGLHGSHLVCECE